MVNKRLFSIVSDANNYASVGATAAATSSKSIKVSTKQVDIGKVGKGFGQVTFLAGIAIDSYGVATGKTSVAKAGTNLGVGLYGMYVNPFVGALYGGLEAFYPGGTEGAVSDYGDTQTIYREQSNGAVFKPGL
ncbi:hypothetical protein [Myroides guanonis]|uniref:Uncharacterized protein n=1 Tax=Myroides guanonis TaxID=1150112 RepID=A0A1I3PFH1_9FLAO|nr:hypothetical protein [Myroides guanonis]SFJ20305.1 hypothetical protein SAMN04487893_104108 [Myroides guanonis]